MTKYVGNTEAKSGVSAGSPLLLLWGDLEIALVAERVLAKVNLLLALRQAMRVRLALHLLLERVLCSTGRQEQGLEADRGDGRGSDPSRVPDMLYVQERQNLRGFPSSARLVSEDGSKGKQTERRGPAEESWK